MQKKKQRQTLIKGVEKYLPGTILHVARAE